MDEVIREQANSFITNPNFIHSKTAVIDTEHSRVRCDTQKGLAHPRPPHREPFGAV